MANLFSGHNLLGYSEKSRERYFEALKNDILKMSLEEFEKFKERHRGNKNGRR